MVSGENGFFFFSSRRRHTRCYRDWSSDVCSSDLGRYATAEQDSHLAAALYGVVMFAMGIAFTLLWQQANRQRHQSPREGLLFSVGLVVYLVAIGVSFISAQLAMLMYLLMAVFYVFPWLPRAGTESGGTL